MLALLLAQAVAVTPVSAEARTKYEPYRQCLLAQAGKIDAAGKSDDAVLDAARNACMPANLNSGTQALFAEMRAGATKEAAIPRLAAFRTEVERQALIAIRAGKAVPPPANPVVTTEQIAIRGGYRAEREVMPAAQRYRACLTGQMERKAIYPDTIVAKTEAGLTACTAERAAAVTMGEEALKAAGWSRKKRTASVAATFDGIDASERSMALQLREMMLKMGGPKEEPK